MVKLWPKGTNGERNATQQSIDHSVTCSDELEETARLPQPIQVHELETREDDEIPYDYSVRPIWETIEELGKSVPDEVWENVPTDLAVNLDHYLYGKEKCNQSPQSGLYQPSKEGE